MASSRTVPKDVLRWIRAKSSVAQSKVNLGWFSQLAARTSDEPVVRMD